MRLKLLTTLFLLTFAGPVFCNQDDEFRTLFQKDYWAFQELSEEKVAQQIPAPVYVPETHHKKPSKLSAAIQEAAPIKETPTIHKFAKDTVWASIKVTVTDKHGSYNFNVQSDSTVTGWEINTTAKTLVKNGDVNQMNVFGVDINQNFTNNLVLTLFISKDDQTNPVFINLY